MKNIVLIICLYIVGNLGFLSNLFPQDVNYDIADIEKVRERFVEAFGGNFVITEESFKADRNKNIFWLVTVKPDKTGYFIIRHNYENRNWGRKYNSHEYHISVAVKGSRRINSYNLSGLKQPRPDICMGDSITIPVLLADYTLNHQFTKESRYGEDFHFDKERIIREKQEEIENTLETEDIINEALPEMVCLGLMERKSIMASLDVSIESYVYFEARKAGRFNLMLSGNKLTDLIIPVIIVPEGRSIKALAGKAHVYEYEDNVASSHSNDYRLNTVTLRAGDKLIVNLATSYETRNKIVKSTDVNKDNKIIERRLIVKKLPFSQDSDSLDYSYDYWIED